MPRANSEFRDVKIAFVNSVGAMSIDAYKAAVLKVSQMEDQYGADPTSVADLTDVAAVFTGASRIKLYSFTLTVDISAAEYAFTYVETVPNAESLS